MPPTAAKAAPPRAVRPRLLQPLLCSSQRLGRPHRPTMWSFAVALIVCAAPARSGGLETLGRGSLDLLLIGGFPQQYGDRHRDSTRCTPTRGSCCQRALTLCLGIPL